MATAGFPDFWVLVLFGAGALVMRGAGCTVNDIADRDFDRAVTRTANRPIASGDVGVFQAIVFLGLLLILGLVVLVQFNLFTIKLGVASLFLVAMYPFMKRFTYWPQAFLGLTFNWGILMGWAAITGGLGVTCFWLYAAGICWTLGYDTIYAHQDKADDLLVGVKSTALKFGAVTPFWLKGFYGATMIFLCIGGVSADLTWPYFIGLAVGGGHLIHQIRRVNLDLPSSCLSVFKSNRTFGLIILAGIILARGTSSV